MTEAAPRFRVVHLAIGLMVALAASVGVGRIASAHTDFDSSAPTDGAVVEGPLSQVVVNFTNPARPADDGFELLDPAGSVRVPSSVDPTDGTSFVLTFDPPLGAGTYGVRWKVQAGDAHPISGSFRFEITGAVTPTTTNPGAAASVTPNTIPPSSAATAGAVSLDEFLDAGAADDATGVGRVGRTITILGMIFGVGVLAALVWTVRGRRDELHTQLVWIRLAGLVVFTGGLVEFAALREIDPAATLGSLLGTKAGVATALKMAGGLAVAVGFHQRSGRIIAPVHSLSAAAAVDLAPPEESTTAHAHDHGEHRWSPTWSAALGLAGYALVLASFWFDGHTVSQGPWAIHSAVNMVHLGAAAVWGGGVFAMTTVAWTRRHRSERTGLAAMVVRFSSVATVALVAVIAAGLLMTWMIVESPSDLVSTQWGRVLLAKIGVVAVAAGIGGYNHFRLRPALDQRPDDPELARHLRVSLSVESAVFVTIAVLTAVLVASAT